MFMIQALNWTEAQSSLTEFGMKDLDYLKGFPRPALSPWKMRLDSLVDMSRNKIISANSFFQILDLF